MQEKNLIKIVADTNILVSVLIGKHLQKFLDYWELDYFRIIYSRETFQELVSVIFKLLSDSGITAWIKYKGDVKSPLH